MRVVRREVLGLSGGLVAALSLCRRDVWAEEVAEIRMQGRADGSHVWFDPIGVLIKPGQMVRWTNFNPGNSHTTTAYHPVNFGRPLRIPESARSWDSDYLLPDESFAITFTEQGVYDYFCVPHDRLEWSAASSSANPKRMADGWRRSLRAAAFRMRPSRRSRRSKK